MSAAVQFYANEHGNMSNQPKNDPDLYLWVLGWLANRYRGDQTLAEVGDALKQYDGKGLTGSGYRKMEKGESANLRAWWWLFEHYGKDVVSILSVSRVLVRAIQEEELNRGRELTDSERDRVVSELYAMFD